MKRDPKPPATRAEAANSSKALNVEIESHVLRDIRKHARSSMTAEICGVLLGETSANRTVVDVCIAGEEARQGGSHVTFTQDTWTHIYKIKDSKFPDKRIVGWYHSHPGFGVFLSEHDIFIHRNFFSDRGQIAWVYDPHTDEEGCFAWDRDDIKRLPGIALRDTPVEGVAAEVDHPSEPVAAEPKSAEHAGEKRVARGVGVVALVVSHLFALVLGAILWALFGPQIILIPERSDSRPANHSPASQPNRSAAP